jgi:hypothetical protein
MTNKELARRLGDLSEMTFANRSEKWNALCELLDKHRPTYATVDEPLEIAKLIEELADRPDVLSYAAEKIYNARFGYHELVKDYVALQARMAEASKLLKL